MASCEKCWRDANSDPHRYHNLLTMRKNNPCTPKQQAGGADALQCPRCGELTLHCYAKVCMRPECGYREEKKCKKCGSPDIYKEWDGFAFCQICFEDLHAEARSTTEPGEADKDE